ncbi:WAT1-related protein At5g40210 isoform X2 [Magnolia sinica]|uniref:WAT1-related protein At5g40210 isoform X2 n=1 Tax=Magnolia sinica TaxID=86752 RepID=UPI002659560E|nr:WAT1-related protein At5g40210 isoform X2 [Magnolia sinica]
MMVHDWFWEVLPYCAMVVVELLDVGMTTLSKEAMSRGMSHFIFVLYSNAFASILLLPSSFFLQRMQRPPLTFRLLCRFFLLALTGITIMQNCVFTGVSYSSPTLASAMGNLIPAFTFILAIIFRLEMVDIRSASSQAKLIGTLVSISGALIVTLYKGPSIKASSPSTHAGHDHSVLLFHKPPSNSLAKDNWAATVKRYPSEITIVAFNCFFGAIQCAIVSLFAERDPKAWILRPDIELISIVYSAVFGSVLTYNVQTWCMQKKGPVFVAMFKPLGIAIAAIMGAMFLGDTLHLGRHHLLPSLIGGFLIGYKSFFFFFFTSVIGAVIIAIGFYAVMWGQRKEEKKDDDKRVGGLETSSTQKVPLLPNYFEN